MPSIRISQTEILNAKHIKAFKASEEESPDDSKKRERVLTITKDNGQELTLRGDPADAALVILRLHGF